MRGLERESKYMQSCILFWPQPTFPGIQEAGVQERELGMRLEKEKKKTAQEKLAGVEWKDTVDLTVKVLGGMSLCKI